MLEICLRADQVAFELGVARGQSSDPRQEEQRQRPGADDRAYDEPKCIDVSRSAWRGGRTETRRWRFTCAQRLGIAMVQVRPLENRPME